VVSKGLAAGSEGPCPGWQRSFPQVERGAKILFVEEERMRRFSITLALALVILTVPVTLPTAAEGIGVGVKMAVYPLSHFGLEKAFIYLRMSDFLGVEGLTAILEGGLGFNLKTISLDTKLLLARFALDGATLIPFTGGGLTLELAPLELIPEGLAGMEYSLPPFLLLGEMRVQSLRGMTILLGLALEL
jgi:hypothetical protein